MQGKSGLLSAVALGLLVGAVLDRLPGQGPTAGPVARTKAAQPTSETPVLIGAVTDPAASGVFLAVAAKGRWVRLTPGQARSRMEVRSGARHRAVFLGQEGEVTLLWPTVRELSPP